MLSKEDFIRRVLDPSALVGLGVAPTEPDDDALSALGGGFGADEVQPAATPTASSFASLLLEASGFGAGSKELRHEVILGTEPVSRTLPAHVWYWPKVSAERPYQTLLFELDTPGSALLADPLFRVERKQEQLEDAVYRQIQHILTGFEKGGEGRKTDAKRGKQTETLVVVSVQDDRGGAEGRHLVCFGTRCAATDALEVFVLRQEARDWEPALAREHLEQLYLRHFSRLDDGAAWQDAFITGVERKAARELLTACSALFATRADILQERIFDLLDAIATGFGLQREGGKGKHVLRSSKLPADHEIGVDPDARVRKDFQNPLTGVRVFDPSERLLGYIVYCLDRGTDPAKLRAMLAEKNHFHNVLVLYPENGGGTFELWQGRTALTGRMLRSTRSALFDGEGGVVQLLTRFFVVSRSHIQTPRDLAFELAWRARHLRALALDELSSKKPARKGDLRDLHAQYNKALARVDTGEFADAYAQTITYGLLAARWLSRASERRFTRSNVAELLPSTSPFLRDLFQKLISLPFDENLSWLLDDVTTLLSRTHVRRVFAGERDPSIHFYQDFLDEYDPKIRKDRGVYYTPDEVVSYIVTTSHQTLKDRFGLPLGLADPTSWGELARARGWKVPKGVKPSEPFVQILDPATGTGTFLLRVIEVIHQTMMAEYARQGLDAAASRAAWVSYVRVHLLPRLNGFELMMAPYIVSHLRLGLALQETGYAFDKKDRLRVYLTNTLEMHDAAQMAFLGEHVADEAKEAQRVKVDAPISVIVGNPPYEREPNDPGVAHKGGWVRDGWSGWRDGRAPLEDFAEPTRLAGAGGHLKNIYNLYVYFWRWATWRVFDRYGAPGVVSFITASSYLRGPGFAGMREELRRSAEAVYVLDLEGDQRGTRVTENVFQITIPVCVASVVSAGTPDRKRAGLGLYLRLAGTAAEKLAFCKRWTSLEGMAWTQVEGEWQGLLMGAETVDYTAWLSMLDVFPWQRSGSKSGRTWVIGESPELLHRRWHQLLAATGDARRELFKDSPTGQKADHAPVRIPPMEGSDRPILDLSPATPTPPIERFGFRSFDRQWILADSRLLDRGGPSGWYVRGPHQVYLTSLLSGVLGIGPAATVSAYVPDLHQFRGSYGGKDVIPLWRDPDATQPNIAAGLLSALTTALGHRPHPEQVFAYAFAVLAHPGYVRRFTDELQIPGPRLPLTKDPALFARGAALGADLIRLQTYGERLRTPDDGFTLSGAARVLRPIPATADGYPEKHRYDPATRTLHVGAGQIGPVAPEIVDFSVSGLSVVKSWLDYRMKKGAGKKSSPLDDIRPERWTPELTDELLQLLWVLEGSLARYPALDAWLGEVISGPLFTAAEIPPPTEAERAEPKIERKRQGKLI